MKKLSRAAALILLVLTVFMCFSVPASALDWDGSSEGGGGHGTDAGPNGYAIRYVSNKNLLGYRFSCVDRYGSNKVSKVIDVFRSTDDAPYADYACDHDLKFTTKYNKKQLINNQNGNFSTSVNNVWCYKQSEMGFASSLPDPDGLETWQNNTTNLNKVLAKLGVGSIENLNYGDKILIEQIYDIRLESVYHALTVTETAIYGKHILGAYSDGGSSSNSESWGFISSYVNKHKLLFEMERTLNIGEAVKDCSKIKRSALKALIDVVRVKNSKDIEIKFKFEDLYRQALDELKKEQAE